MRGLAAAETLAVWDRAGAEPVATRPVALLDAASGGADPETLPLGQRDAALLRLCAATFGDQLDALASCPSCATPVELSLSCVDLLRGAAGPAVEPLKVRGYVIDWRLPNSADLAAVAGSGDATRAGTLLLRRCLRSAELDGAAVAATELPAEVREAVGQAMAEADPLAEIVLGLDCPQCPERWSSRLDVAEFVWSRLNTAAQRLLREVDALARAYGWSEPEILALSEPRRAAYLRLVHGG